MNGTIYDFSALPRTAWFGPDAMVESSGWRGADAVGAPVRVGLVINPRSRRNKALGGVLPQRPGVSVAAPGSRAELRDVLARFAAERIDLLAVDGGDGTVRDVLTCAGDAWAGRWPRLAVIPTGKTNALALDLGLPRDWTLDRAIEAARSGRIATRSPVAVERIGEPAGVVRGFLFGTGVFVTATSLAQRTHRAGAFNNFAVGLALAGAIGQTLFGAADGKWRRGAPMRLRYEGRPVAMHGAALSSERDQYLTLASTLERLPLGVRPFGRTRPGLKVLTIDAPARQGATVIPALLAGSEAAWIERAGYHRVDAASVEVELAGEFILDGEVFPGGRYRIFEDVPLRFVVP